MPAAVSRDSLAKCEQPSMLYDAIRYPNAPSLPPKPRTEAAGTSKDTLETTQQRLNREMMDKFQNASPRLSHHSYVAVAQTGKYLFLAVMLPPYLCCYGIPKWILTTLLPQTFSTVKNQLVRVGNFFAELSTRVADLMKGALEQMLGDTLRASRRQASAFKNYFKNLVRKQAARLALMKKKASHFHASVHKGIYDAFIRGRDALRRWLEERALQVIEKVVRALKKFFAILLYPVDLCDRYIFIPVIAYFKAKFAIAFGWGKAIFYRLTDKISHMKNRLLLKLQPVASFVKHYAYKGAVRLQGRWTSLLQKLKPISVWANAKAALVQAYGGRCLRRIGNFLSKPLHWSLQKFLQVVKKGKSYSKDVVQRAGVKLRQWIFSPWKSIVKALQERKAGKLAKRTERRRRIKWFLAAILSLFKVVIRGCASLAKALWSMSVWWVKRLISFPARCLAAGICLFWMGVSGARKCIYGMRIGIAWSVAFYRLGMIHVREFSAFLQKKPFLS